MLRIKDFILIVGLIVASLGYVCLPSGQNFDAEQNLSFFAQASSSGAFLSVGFLALASGLLIIGFSFILPPRK